MSGIGDIAACLGRPAAQVVARAPFDRWRFERSVETDLGDPSFDYLSDDASVEIAADAQDRAVTVFLLAEAALRLGGELATICQDGRRTGVLARFGTPAASGAGIVDPILGALGGWDRFARHGYGLHFEYRAGCDAVKRITVMAAEATPPVAVPAAACADASTSSTSPRRTIARIAPRPPLRQGGG